MIRNYDVTLRVRARQQHIITSNDVADAVEAALGKTVHFTSATVKSVAPVSRNVPQPPSAVKKGEKAP